MGVEQLLVIAACVLAGVGVGVLSGLLGIGGGTVMVPLLRLVVGLSPVMSTATSLFTIIPTSISGVVSHLRARTCVPPIGVLLGLGGALTSPLGVQLAHHSPSWMVMSAAAIVIAYSAITMLVKARKKACTQAAVSGEAGAASSSEPSQTSDAAPVLSSTNPEASIPSSAEEEVVAPPLTKKLAVVAVSVGLLAGVMSGYVGVGGGFLIVPLLMTLTDLPMKSISGTSLLAVLILAIPATIQQGLLGSIDYAVGCALAVGSIPGAVLGARLVRVMPEQTIRMVFGAVLLIGAAGLVLNEVLV